MDTFAALRRSFKVFGLLGLFGGTLLASEAPSNPYHPYPIIFVHGFATSSKCFGVQPADEDRDGIDSDYHENGYTHGYDPHDTYAYFLVF